MSDHELVMETFKSAGEYIGKVRHAVEEIVEYIQTGRENIALVRLSELPEAIEWLIQVKQLTETINLKYRIDIDREQLNNLLAQIVEAQANKDFVTIADCLEYEILPAIEKYRGELERIQEEFN